MNLPHTVAMLAAGQSGRWRQSPVRGGLVSYGSDSQCSGRSARSGISRLSPRMTAPSRLRGSTCAIVSRHRPHGGRRIPSSDTATTARACVSLAFNISATAATSAQKPSPHAKLMQMPVYMFPCAVRMAAPTEPAEKSSRNLKAPHTVFAASMSVILATCMSFMSPNRGLTAPFALILRDEAGFLEMMPYAHSHQSRGTTPVTL